MIIKTNSGTDNKCSLGLVLQTNHCVSFDSFSLTSQTDNNNKSVSFKFFLDCILFFSL